MLFSDLILSLRIKTSIILCFGRTKQKSSQHSLSLSLFFRIINLFWKSFICIIIPSARYDLIILF